MLRRTTLLAIGAAALAPAVFAQSAPRRVARVGWLGWTGDTAAMRDLPLDAMRAGLAELGWREGLNLHIEQRAGDREQAGKLTAELVAAGVEVIVAQGPMGIFARHHLGRVPLVFTINGDPVEAGIAASLSHPGGLLTGLTALGEELAAKRVELLRSARPGLQRVAALANELHPGRRIEHDATLAAARQLGLAMQYVPVRTAADFDAAFAAMAAAGVQAIVAFPDTLINRQAQAIAEFCRRQRVAAISGWAEFAQAGNLLAYGPEREAFYRRTAHYVHKILEGTRAAELPVERPTRIVLAVNQAAARAIALALPQSLVLRAEQVIE